MSHVRPLSRGELEQFEPYFQVAEQMMGGFVPNSLFTMGHRPEILQAFMMLAGTINGPGTVDPGLKQLVAYVASNAAGCRYCQAHTSTHAAHAGIAADKIEHAFEFESHPGFSDAERAALRLARDSALQPNLVEAGHFDALRKHFDEQADRRAGRGVGAVRLPEPVERHHGDRSRGRAARLRRGPPRRGGLGGRQARLTRASRSGRRRARALCRDCERG